jgi:hypothetical protein
MRWWLDHYTELADHLANESTRVVEEDGVGMLFELRPHRLSSVALGSSTATSSVSAVDFQLHSLREAVLPPDASWVTLSRAVGGFLEGHQAAPIVSEPDAPLSGTDLIDRLEGLRRRGAEYLVIPAEESEWLETQVAFRRYLNRFRTVVAQRRICSIFELGQCPGVQTEPPTSSPNLTSEQSESV